MDLANKVKARREQLGMSQEELATKMGYSSRSSINKIENGRPVSQKIIVRLAEALHTTPAHLLGWDQEEIEAVSELQAEVNASMDVEEESLMSLQEEFAEMHFTSDEIRRIKNFMHLLKEKEGNFGTVVKKAREEKGMSLEQLADKIGATAEQVADFENIDSFPLQILKKLHEVLGITYYDVFEAIWYLRLNDEELADLYDYAKYIKSKRQ